MRNILICKFAKIKILLQSSRQLTCIYIEIQPSYYYYYLLLFLFLFIINHRFLKFKKKKIEKNLNFLFLPSKLLFGGYKLLHINR
jgi:hypothetical protein